MSIKNIFLFFASCCVVFSLFSCDNTVGPNDTTTASASTSANVETSVNDNNIITEDAVSKIVVDPASAGGNGTAESPYSSIFYAQEKIRAMKKADLLPAGGVTVILRSGIYDISDGIVFSAEDSGSKECPIRYVAEEEHGAILTGGLLLNSSDFRPLTDAEKAALSDPAAAEKILCVDLKNYGLNQEDWGKLYAYGITNASLYEDGVGEQAAEFFCGGQRMSLSRYPNEGYLAIKDVIDPGHYWEDIDHNPGPPLAEGEIPRGPSLAADDETAQRMANWTLNDCWIYGYLCYDWHGSSYPISALGENGNFVLKYMSSYAPRPGGRYYFFNIFEEIDTEGEYYINREDGILYFYPPKHSLDGEIMLTVSLCDLMTLENVEYVTFEDLYIGGSRKNAIVGSGNHLTFDNCIIRNVRLDGLTLTGTHNTLINSEIASIGCNGVTIIGGDTATLTKSENLIHNNYIHHIADSGEGNAVSTGGCGNTVSHNEICYTPLHGMSGTALLDVIEYNEIHHTCLDGSDCGAIYSQAGYTNYGGVIRYNYIHDIGVGDTEANGIYWDDASSGQTAYGNVIVNTTGFGFMIGGGRDNHCTNNMLINTRKGGIRYDCRAYEGTYDGGWWGSYDQNWQYAVLASSPYQHEPWASMFPQLASVTTDIANAAKDDPNNAVLPANSDISRNIIYFDLEKSVGYKFDSIVKKYSNVKNNGIIKRDFSDFLDAANGNFMLKNDAMVYAEVEGFEAIPFDEIGRLDKE